MKINIKKLQDGNFIPTYSLPEINIYPQNRFGDIARSQGINTARNWRTVKNSTTKGINDFASSVKDLAHISGVPLISDAADVADFISAYKRRGR